MLWDVKYRFDKKLNLLGKHLIIDFDVPGHQFLTVTTLGYLCKWSVEKQVIEKAFKVLHPVTKQIIYLQ